MTVAQKPAAGAAAGTDDARALDLLRRHGDHSSAFLAFNDPTRHFMPEAVDGLVAYRPAGRRHAFQLFGPLSAPEDRGRLLDEFTDWASSKGRRVTAVEIRSRDVPLYAERGFAVNQLGSSYTIDLDEFTLRGTRFMKLRNKLKRSKRLGVTVEEVPAERLAEPGADADLAAIDADWLKGKGWHAKELEFMIGVRGGRGLPHRRVFMARHDGRPIAYVTYSPVWGERPGWLYDLTRRRRDAPPGTIDLVFHTGLERLREEGVRWLHLGFTPFTGLAREHEPADASSRLVRTVTEQLAKRGEAIYPAVTQEAFKLKWAPQHIEPEYVAFERGPSAGAVWQILRLTRSI